MRRGAADDGVVHIPITVNGRPIPAHRDSSIAQALVNLLQFLTFTGGQWISTLYAASLRSAGLRSRSSKKPISIVYNS